MCGGFAWRLDVEFHKYAVRGAKIFPSAFVSFSMKRTTALFTRAGILSHAEIDHIIQGYFGWLGAHAVMAIDIGGG